MKRIITLLCLVGSSCQSLAQVPSPGLLKGGSGTSLNLVAILYYTWSNRGIDAMKV